MEGVQGWIRSKWGNAGQLSHFAQTCFVPFRIAFTWICRQGGSAEGRAGGARAPRYRLGVQNNSEQELLCRCTSLPSERQNENENDRTRTRTRRTRTRTTENENDRERERERTRTRGPRTRTRTRIRTRTRATENENEGRTAQLEAQNKWTQNKWAPRTNRELIESQWRTNAEQMEG